MLSRIATVNVAAFAFIASMTSAQADLLWNPTQTDPYQPVGGNGSWSATEVWWDGAQNVTIAQKPGDVVVFEGSGTVTGGTFSPQRMFFDNLTGDYAINVNMELELPNNTGHAVHVTGGSHNVSIQSLGYSNGTGASRSVRNDGTGTLTLGSVLRRFGGSTTNLAMQGDGDFALNGAGSMGGQLIKNGAGHLAIGGSMNSFTNGIVLNAGSMSMDNNGTSLTWNDGKLMYLLSNIDNDSNTIALSSTFTKGSGSDFVFDFQNTGLLGETYTLLTFATTDFVASDFTALNADGFFTVNSSDVTFTVIPEPASLALMGLGGLMMLGRGRRA